MRIFFMSLSVLIVQAFSGQARPLVCENSVVSVSPQNSDKAALVCQAAIRAEMLFETCNVPPLSRPIRIDIVTDLKPGFAGAYHRGEDWIEVLEAPLMDAVRNPESAFGFLPIDEYFKSVVVHELAHAAFEAVPCPLASCVASNAYIAYAMQVMSLAPDAQLTFEKNAGLNRRISRDELSPMFLFMAPGRFAQKAWTHLSQRDHPCNYIGRITDGTVLLDRERF